MSDNQEALRLADALEAIHENNSDSLLALNVIRQAGPELRRLHAENEALKTELIEQARVNGMGGERCAAAIRSRT